MISLIDSPLELATAATDAIIALLCVGIALVLNRYRKHDAWKTTLWFLAFMLLAAASALGAVAHGFEWSQSVKDVLWIPLYLFLGLVVALFLVGAVYDGLGSSRAKRLMPWAIGAGIAFWLYTQLADGAFLIFVMYEAVAMILALVLYARLAVAGGLACAWVVAVGIGLNMIAGLVQASDFSFTFIVAFDHNGVFHLVQMVALVTIGYGLRGGLRTLQTRTDP